MLVVELELVSTGTLVARRLVICHANRMYSPQNDKYIKSNRYITEGHASLCARFQ